MISSDFSFEKHLLQSSLDQLHTNGFLDEETNENLLNLFARKDEFIEQVNGALESPIKKNTKHTAFLIGLLETFETVYTRYQTYKSIGNVSDEIINSIVAMGFERKDVENALVLNSFDSYQAIVYLMNGNDKSESDFEDKDSLFILVDDDDDDDFGNTQSIDFDHNTYNLFECPICMTDIHPGEGYIINNCLHKYCRECLMSYLYERIMNKKVVNIPCPHPGCKSSLQYCDIKVLVEPELFQKYETFTLYQALNQDPNVKWCPNPQGCGNAILTNPNAQNNHLTCNECQYEFCGKCLDEWHIGTCEELEQWKIDNGTADEKFIKWSKKNSKNCPKCKIRIQKVSGCNHMTCTYCNYQFCWLCNGPYQANHYDTFNPFGCPGMQFQQDERFITIKRIATKTLIGAALIICGACSLGVAVPCILIGGPIYGSIKLVKQIRM